MVFSRNLRINWLITLLFMAIVIACHADSLAGEHEFNIQNSKINQVNFVEGVIRRLLVDEEGLKAVRIEDKDFFLTYRTHLVNQNGERLDWRTLKANDRVKIQYIYLKKEDEAFPYLKGKNVILELQLLNGDEHENTKH